jgi:hypothetical protein
VAGQETGVQVHLSPIRVHGTVRLGTKPARGFHLTIFSDDAVIPGRGGEDAVTAATTDEEGEYEATLWSAGKYSLSLTNPRGTPATAKWQDLEPPEEVIDFQLDEASVSGIVEDQAGKAVEGAAVVLRWQGSDNTSTRVAFSAADGTFQFPMVASGPAALQAHRESENGVIDAADAFFTSLATARREAARTGGRVIFGDSREDGWDDDWWDDDRRATRFDRLDLNDDGFLSRSEWPADTWIFDRFDRNDDDRLSRSEIRNPDLDRDELLEERFQANDLDRDGRLSSREWWGRDTQFELLDRNGDDYLSLTEVLERNPEDYRLFTRRFQELDRDRDGLLSEREWTGNLAEFSRRDRNNDGFLSLDEWLRRT